MNSNYDTRNNIRNPKENNNGLKNHTPEKHESLKSTIKNRPLQFRSPKMFPHGTTRKNESIIIIIIRGYINIFTLVV